MPELRVKPQKRPPRTNPLLAKRRDVYSQSGEDGVIEEIFRLIGETNRWCVEFGAWDGVFLSNTCRLIRECGWSAVLIEGDAERCRQIRANHPDEARVHPLNKMVGFLTGVDTIDHLLKRTPIPRDFDMLSIDVDGVDWHVWESIVEHRPRLVVIEFNPTVPNDVVFVQDRDMAINEGCSLAALIELGTKKGYALAALTNGNAFFVVKEEFAKVGAFDNSIHAMRTDRPNYLFNCYNGKIYHTMGEVSWYGRGFGMRPDSLQFVSEFRFHGSAQGRAPGEPDPPAEGAEALLRELVVLNRDGAQMPREEYAQRIKTAWRAAHAHVARRRGFAYRAAALAARPASWFARARRGLGLG